ncbi:S8 family serine peptidase [bacterium]|nr:S8 family serine peptidase [bacterium]
MRSRYVILAALLLLAAGTVFAAPASRPFAPVQNGFDAVGTREATFHPERVLVQFRAANVEKAMLAVPFVRGAEMPGARTGIASVDALLARDGVVRVSRPYDRPARMDKAAELGVDRWFLLEAPGADVQALAADLAKDPTVAHATVDWYAFPASVPNDPLYADHWGHNNTAQMISYDWSTYSHTGPTVGTVGFDSNAQAAWDQTYGDPNVVIAIIDSGVDIYHEDLSCTAGYDFGDNDTNPMDDSRSAGHGTCCAGVTAAVANNGTGIVGIAGNCTIMPLKVADRRGSMSFTSITNALYYAADHDVDVISMSLGAAISSDAATDAAIAYAYNAGCTILAATGNENNSVISYPAINEYVIGVGAASPCGDRKRSSSLSTELNPGVYADPNGYTCDGERWWGSNYGPATQDDRGAVDIIAPTIVPTTDISGSAGYDAGNYDMFFNGTSCATPYAAGVCALIKSAFPDYTPAQVRAQLVSTAQDIVNVESGAGWDRYSGYGMVDAAAAIAGGGGPVENPPVAAFSGSPTSGDYPLVVAFSDQSANAPTSWAWTFGDGGTATVQNPDHTYAAAGVYTVSLTVTNAYGADTEIKTGYITVTEPSAGGGTMHVADMNVYKVLSGRKYYGRCDVSVVDDTGAPVAAATVTATYSGDISGTVSGVTGSDGWVTLSTLTKAYANSPFCFTVTNVTHATLDYASGDNLVTQSCEGGDVYGAESGRVVGLTGLGRNWPNPFNPQTDIAFSLAREGRVRLAVYNVKGELVDVLAEGVYGVGEHVFTFNGQDRPSGVYFYRLEAPGFTETRKMIMLK